MTQLKNLEIYMTLKTRIITLLLSLIPAVSLSAGENISLSAGLNKSEIPFEGDVELKLEIKWQGDISSYVFEVLPLPELENLNPTYTQFINETEQLRLKVLNLLQQSL